MVEAPGGYQCDVAAVRAQLPETLDVLVPTGMTSHWLHALDWPKWVWTGTSLKPRTSLPKGVRLIDDLQLIANMLDGVGARQLLRMILEWSRFPASARTLSLILAAPNLGEALDLTTAWTKRLHPLLRISLDHKDDTAVLRIVAYPGLGKLAPFLAAAAVLYWYRLLEMFFLNEQSTREHRAQISLQSRFLVEWLEPDLRERLPYRIEPGGGDDCITCPARLLKLRNPAADPELWAEATAELERRNDFGSTGFLTLYLHNMVAEALARQERIPLMAEVSRNLGVSARTLARKIADDGLTYHAIIITIRQRIAKRLLLSSSLTVSEISNQLGFTDSSSFVRSFRTWFGQSPGQWRKLNG